MSSLLDTAGGGAGAAGELLGGYAGMMAGQAEAKYDNLMASSAEWTSTMKLIQQDRMSYQVMGRTQAAIGANGGTVGGSAESILRMNAQNLAMDHSIIKQQGLVEAAGWHQKAKAATQAGNMAMISGVIKAGASVATM